MKQVSLWLVLLMAGVMISVAGCGKNVVGPTAPEVIVSSAEVSEQSGSEADKLADESEAANASCHAAVPAGKRSYNSLKYKYQVKRYVRKHIGRYLRNFRTLKSLWFFSPPYRMAWYHLVLSNKLFVNIVWRFNIDRQIIATAMEIMAQAYRPGDSTNPGNFNPEVTLFPFKWIGFWRGGFDNTNLLPGWEVVPNSTDGYVFNTRNENNDLVSIDTKSYLVDVYTNNYDIRRFHWIYSHDPVGLDFYKIELEMQDQPELKRYKLDLRLNAPDGVVTDVDIWRSTEDASGSFRILKTDGTLSLNLTFDAQGNGGGTLTILNKQGQMDHYHYVVDIAGKSYFTINGSEPIYM